jgi:hypothetical protein
VAFTQGAKSAEKRLFFITAIRLYCNPALKVFLRAHSGLSEKTQNILSLTGITGFTEGFAQAQRAQCAQDKLHE